MLFGSTIVDYAANALVLALTPTHSLPSEKKKQQEDFMIRRNRVLTELETLSSSLGSAEQTILKIQIYTIRNFFGPHELPTDPSRNFGWIANTTDSMICSTIINSLKTGAKGITEKERAKNEATRDAILNSAKLKAKQQGPETEKRLDALFVALGIGSPCTATVAFG